MLFSFYWTGLADAIHIWCSLVLLKVTSKGVGLNPNAKVWQEIPVVSSEVAADATPWSPSDVNDGETCNKTPHFSET